MDYDKYILEAAARQRAAAAASSSSSSKPTDFDFPPFEDLEDEDVSPSPSTSSSPKPEKYEKELPRRRAYVDDYEDEEPIPPPPPPPPPELPSDQDLAEELNSSSASFLLQHVIYPLPLYTFYLFLAYLAVIALQFGSPYLFIGVRWILNWIGWGIIKLVNGTEWVTKAILWLLKWTLKIVAGLGAVGSVGAFGLYCYWAQTNPLRRLSYDRLALIVCIPIFIFSRYYFSLPIPKLAAFFLLVLSFLHISSAFTPFTTRDLVTLPWWFIRNYRDVKEEMAHQQAEGVSQEKLDQQWEELMRTKTKEKGGKATDGDGSPKAGKKKKKKT